MINLSLSMLTATAVSTIFALVLSLIFKSLTVVIAWTALGAGLAAGIFTFVFIKRNIPLILKSSPDQEPRPDFYNRIYDIIIVAAFILFCLREFLWLYFYRDGQMFILNKTNYGDLPLHITYINHLLNGAAFWPENPIFAGSKLHYHFGVDLFTALFVKIGMPIVSVLPVIGLIFGILTLVALYRWGGSFVAGSFLFAGGLAGFRVFLGGFQDYQADLAWKNLALTLLIPQRPFLFAFPAGLWILWSWRRRYLLHRKGLPVWLEGLLWGVMPFFQIHTFLFLSLVLLFWALVQKNIRETIRDYAPAAMFAAVLMFQMLSGMKPHHSLIWFKPGWDMDARNIVWSLFHNFGLYFPLTLWALFETSRRRDRISLLLLIPALLLFSLLMFVMLTPWEWDNVKIVVWCYFLILPVIWNRVLVRFGPVMRGIVLLLLFFSGFVSVASSVSPANPGFSIVNLEEMDGTCHALRRIPNHYRIATSQYFKHPVAFCGHPLVLGDPGQLWSHGLDTESERRDMEILMMGEDGWRDAALRLKVRYLFWGSHETEVYPESRQPWERECVQLDHGKWGALYDLGSFVENRK